MWELDYKERWGLKNWCFWTVVLEKTLENPLNLKEIQPVHAKGDQSWVFIGGTDVEAETPILWPPDMKSWLIWEDPDAGKDWGQEEKRMTEDEMVGWHHQLNGQGFGWTSGVGDGQRGLVCWSSWGCKESDMTERMNWNWKLNWCWERLRAGGEGEDRGWDFWMASPTQWTWVWVNPGSWWWTGRPGVLRFMGSQSQILLSNWTELN